MASEAQKKAGAKYDAAHTKQIMMKLNTGTDADILEHLQASGNVQGYIKQLIRDDMEGRRTEWIPVTERLPENDEIVLVSCRTQKGVNNVNRAYYSNGSWHGSGSMSGVKAWQPLPDPYDGE